MHTQLRGSLSYEQIVQSTHKSQENEAKEILVHWFSSEKVFWKEGLGI